MKITSASARHRYEGAVEALERMHPGFFFEDCMAFFTVNLGANMLMFSPEPKVVLHWDPPTRTWVSERPIWSQPN